MTKSKRLKPIAKVASQRQEQAANVLHESRKVLADAETSWAQLDSYRREYARQQNEAAEGTVSARQLKHLQGFIEQLEHAAHRAKGQMVKVQGACARNLETWVAAHARSRAIEKAISRYTQTEQRAQRQREQVQLDEHPSKNKPRRPRGSDSKP